MRAVITRASRVQASLAGTAAKAIGIGRRLKRARRVLRHDEDAILAGPVTYNQDGLASRHNCDFMHDERFREAYRLGKATGSWGDYEVHWRAYLLCWWAEHVARLPGDFVECGVNRGGFARTILQYVGPERLAAKKFYLLDTFCGLVAEDITTAEAANGISAYRYADCYADAHATFRPFPNVELIRGRVPDTLTQVPSSAVCFLSIDMNCAAPEIAAAEHFWPRLTTGAVMILDDYGFQGHEVQKEAFDRFARDRKVQVLSLPTGQGLILKP